jgi:uncharacterized membrane protein
MNSTTELEGYPKDDDDSAHRPIVSEQTTLVHHQGPLPHPALLKQYDDVVPGAAERIITMAENQAQHRQELEASVIRTDTLKSLLGMVFGFLIALVGFGGGLYAAFAGQPFWGGAVSIGILASVVIAFIYGTRARERELKRR